jgi:hypothetical protein
MAEASWENATRRISRKLGSFVRNRRASATAIVAAASAGYPKIPVLMAGNAIEVQSCSFASDNALR